MVPKLRALIERKPLAFLILSILYLALLVLFRWGVHPTVEILWFLCGGIFGIYFLDIAEVFFSLRPSPFRSVFFEAPFALVCAFVVTSSGSMFASGLVLSILETILLWQVGEWRVTGALNGWFALMAAPVTLRVQRWTVIISVILFFLMSVLFVR
ncbi:hypothetical protein M1555_04810 [Patescibacteria group bacterium]|nr:hypothetical protein [Patescibacteria group bacterium]